MSEPRQIRVLTPKEKDGFDRAVAASVAEVRERNERGEREARANGARGQSIDVGRGFVAHPDDRGALPRLRGEQCWDCAAPPIPPTRRCSACAEKHRARARAANAAAKVSGKRWTR